VRRRPHHIREKINFVTECAITLKPSREKLLENPEDRVQSYHKRRIEMKTKHNNFASFGQKVIGKEREEGTSTLDSIERALREKGRIIGKGRKR